MRLERGTPPNKFISRLVIGLTIGFYVAALAGDLLLADFIDNHPLALIALNARIRNLAFVANQVSAVSYYAVGFVRLAASDPLFFLLGYWYGEKAIDWIAKRSRTYGPLVRDGESLFRKASYAFVFFAPNNIVCALGGATGMRLRNFIALNISGTVARLVVVRLIAARIEPTITAVVDFITKYRLAFFVIAALALAWTVFREFKGDDGEVKSLLKLDEDSNSDTTSDSSD